mmetsp:Transcript_24689/g.50025  ORF Transcript_24689/g.50025 Transcript_24689/m.50025 type:complete len:89 (-) Transcript_24689:263-529(-)
MQKVPQGARPGGEWKEQKYTGRKTYFAACGVCLIFFPFSPLLLCCPLDKRYVYQEPGEGGRLLDEAGEAIHGGKAPTIIPPDKECLMA